MSIALTLLPYTSQQVYILLPVNVYKVAKCVDPDQMPLSGGLYGSTLFADARLSEYVD